MSTPLFDVRIIDNASGTPDRKLADAEIVFTAGILAGIKIIGFGIWLRKGTEDAYTVTMPARQYAVNGEKRSYALVRPATGGVSMDGLTGAILDAYRAHRIAAGLYVAKVNQ